MSDERFDQDLRSVLIDDAPRDVPDDLRRRVAAVPTTHPVMSRASGWSWGLPALLRTGALATVAILLAVAFLQLMPAPGPGVGDDPSRSPSVMPSVAPSATASASGAIGDCLAADITGAIHGWQGAAGSRIADVEITNASTRPCIVQGTPELLLVDAGGSVLIDSATAGPSGQPHVAPSDPVFELVPGGRLRTEVRVSNYCGAAPSPPINIRFTLGSGGGTFVATPDVGVSSAEAVPPCLGLTGNVIDMNGWRP